MAMSFPLLGFPGLLGHPRIIHLHKQPPGLFDEALPQHSDAPFSRQ
jgi:hypothetical protein